jgi:hypothetical protein
LFCPEVFEFDDATGELTELQARLSVFCSLFSSQFFIGSVNLRANFFTGSSRTFGLATGRSIHQGIREQP